MSANFGSSSTEDCLTSVNFAQRVGPNSTKYGRNPAKSGRHRANSDQVRPTFGRVGAISTGIRPKSVDVEPDLTELQPHSPQMCSNQAQISDAWASPDTCAIPRDPTTPQLLKRLGLSSPRHVAGPLFQEVANRSTWVRNGALGSDAEGPPASSIGTWEPSQGRSGGAHPHPTLSSPPSPRCSTSVTDRGPCKLLGYRPMLAETPLGIAHIWLNPERTCTPRRSCGSWTAASKVCGSGSGHTLCQAHAPTSRIASASEGSSQHGSPCRRPNRQRLLRLGAFTLRGRRRCQARSRQEVNVDQLGVHQGFVASHLLTPNVQRAARRLDICNEGLAQRVEFGRFRAKRAQIWDKCGHRRPISWGRAIRPTVAWTRLRLARARAAVARSQ